VEPGARWDVDGRTRLEDHLEAGLAGLMIGLWLGFLISLSRPEGGRGWFWAVSLLHLLPLPIVLTGTEAESQQLLGFGAFGGLALILGVPHHFWPKGRRAWPRVLVIVGVGVGFGLLYLGRRSLA